MAKLILCPYHKEDTPSLALYPDGFRCFGCGKFGQLSELGLKDLPQLEEVDPEDVAEKMVYISALPFFIIRGLSLPRDGDGFYIVWPDHSYYKRRNWEGKPKYTGPAGHKQPLLWVANPPHAKTCLIVEGELNALSFGQVCEGAAIVSPGSASNFKSQVKYLLPAMINYDRVIIVADQDSAGAIACIELMGQLSGKVKSIRAHLMPEDANDLLQKGTLREEVQRIMGEGPR